ncbi:MAG TPA: rhodanese-like domain-containing protein [Burkholderiales bacterium]|nr:rhodanese-like domain-containing protein [Burkholderiales bacterium]
MQHDMSFQVLVDEVRPLIKELTVLQVKQKFDNGEKFVFIDVREDHEWVVSHIPKAIHIGRGILERDIAANISDKNSEIILYCGGGFRSALSAYNLQKMGYSNVASMDGGIREWKELGFPLNK